MFQTFHNIIGSTKCKQQNASSKIIVALTVCRQKLIVKKFCMGKLNWRGGVGSALLCHAAPVMPPVKKIYLKEKESTYKAFRMGENVVER